MDDVGGAREMKEKKNINNMIMLNHINKYYQIGENKLHVLKDISLEVQEGEFLAVLGPSGSGKSTLMNIIGCMDISDTGEYYLDGMSIHNTKEKKLVRVRNEKIGFIFQKYHLIQTYNVKQNIVMPLLMRGKTLKEAFDDSKEIIEMLGLSERLEHRPRELSGGQQQRAAIARALVGNPAILLADEPTGALDTASGAEVLKLFKRLNDLGNTIVMITHDQEVAKHAKRMVRIVDGQLFQS